MNRKPLCIDLFCGLGGWAEGFLAEGWTVIGFDLERHRYRKAIQENGSVKRPGMNWSDRTKTGAEAAMFNRPPRLDPDGGWMEYPGQLIIQDVLTLHGSQFKDADCIVASPPCQEYSYMAMPWSRAKVIAAEYRSGKRDVKKLTELFDACFRIQREACEAAGRHIPMVVENVRGAQPWVGRARWNFGSFYLWGDVPALMPIAIRTFKQPNRNFHFPEKFGIPSPSFHGAAHESSVIIAEGLKTVGHLNKRNGHEHTQLSSKSNARKAASAMIAKIPFPLAQWIARTYYPKHAPSQSQS